MNVYEAPFAEMIPFNYRQQVATSTGNNNCISYWVNRGTNECTSDNQFLESNNQ